MSKVRVFFRRLASGSFKRMLNNINVIHNDTGKSRIITFLDMLWCIARYDIGYLEYRVFNFAEIKGAKKRSTFMTMNHSLALVHMLNDKSGYEVFDDKINFNATFANRIGRDYINIHSATAEQLKDFCADKKYVFAKATTNYGGQGVERLTITDDINYDDMLTRLRDNGQWLVEEAIVQHEDMSRLCAASVNTIRIVTVLMPEGAKMVYALLRMGSGNKEVDNITSGGMYTWVPADGVLKYPAFCDKTGLFYDKHPVSGTVFAGYKLPYFKEAVEMCCEESKRVPKMRYIGWDVAITENGPILVEGNNLPGYDMPQNGKFHEDGRGLLPLFEDIIGQKIPKTYTGPVIPV